MNKWLHALFFLIALTGCSTAGRPMFVPTGNPVSDVLVNAMIEEGIASTGRSFMQELIAELKGNFNAWRDRRARREGRCPNAEYDPRLGIVFCGHWD